MSEPTFAVGDRVWVSAVGTDGGDAGYATLIAIRDNGTCDLRDDNDAEYWSLLSHLTPTQPPAPTEATARDVIASVVAKIDGLDASHNLVDHSWVTDAILAALAEAGLVIVPSTVTECPGCGRWHDDVVCPYCDTEWDGRAR